MDANRDEKELSEPKLESRPSPNAVNEDDSLALRSWFDGLRWQDPRYDDKLLLKLAALSMGSDEMRQRLISDPESLVQEVRSYSDRSKVSWASALDGVNLRFWENTPDTLHIVLPPRAGFASLLPESLKDALRSRTSLARDYHRRDDSYNFGDFGDSYNRGDYGQDFHDV